MQKPIEPIRWRDIGNLAENLGVRGSVDRAGIDHGVSMLNAQEKTSRGSDFDGRAAFSACDRSVSFTSFQRSRDRSNSVDTQWAIPLKVVPLRGSMLTRV